MKNPLRSIRAEYLMRCYAGQSKRGAALAIVLHRFCFSIGVLIGSLITAPMTSNWPHPAVIGLLVLSLLYGLFWA